MKFCFRRGDKKDIKTVFEGLDWDAMYKYLDNVKEGTRMHLVVRPRPGFDVEAKRNYFHGPMLTWIIGEFHKIGIPVSREQMKDEFKARFLGLDVITNKVKSFADTLEVMTKGDARCPEEKWGEFLSDVRNWCRDVLDGEPPQPDQSDLGEEQDKCAQPEMT